VKRIDDKPLTFPVGDKEYTIPPVGWDCGLILVKYLAMDNTALGKVKMKSEDLFKLVMSDEVWEQMVTDRVASHIMFRAGLAALAHFKTLAEGGTPEVALLAAETVWESGIDPETLAASMAAKLANPAVSTTSPSTAAARSSTKRPANTKATTSQASKKKAPPSTPLKS
jgi:hypothetical protein